MARIRIDLHQLRAKKEAELNRRITYQEIYEATGVSESTIADWMLDRANRFDANTLIAFCDFFGCEVGDILRYEK